MDVSCGDLTTNAQAILLFPGVKPFVVSEPFHIQLIGNFYRVLFIGLTASNIIFMRCGSFVLSCLLNPNIYVTSLAHLTAQDANSHVSYTTSLLRLRFGDKISTQNCCLHADQYDHVNSYVLAELCFASVGFEYVTNLSQDDIAFYLNNIQHVADINLSDFVLNVKLGFYFQSITCMHFGFSFFPCFSRQCCTAKK